MRCQVEWMLFAMGLAQVTGQPSGGIYGPVPCEFSSEVSAKKPTKAIELLLEELPHLNLDVKPKKIHKRIDVPPSIPNTTSSTPIPEAPPMPPTPVTTLPPPPPPTPQPVQKAAQQPTESKVVKQPEGPKSVCARSMAVGVVGYSILCEKRRLAKASASATTTTTTTTPPPPTTTVAPASHSLLDPRWQVDKMSSQEYDRLAKQLDSLMRCGNFRCRHIDESLESFSDQ